MQKRLALIGILALAAILAWAEDARAAAWLRWEGCF
jgi:hypothetical protein